MKSYRPGMVPDDPAQLPGFLRQEQVAIQQAANRADTHMALQVLYAEPARMFAGMVCYFDGTSFNPGSGEGVYVRDLSNAAWRYLG